MDRSLKEKLWKTICSDRKFRDLYKFCCSVSVSLIVGSSASNFTNGSNYEGLCLEITYLQSQDYVENQQTGKNSLVSVFDLKKIDDMKEIFEADQWPPLVNVCLVDGKWIDDAN